MKYLKLYEEYSNSDSFYLVIDDVNKLMNNPDFKEKSVLHGLKGISENKDILNVLGTPCDVFITMNKNAVLSENTLVKVDYSDINFLTNNHFQIFKRIKSNGLQFLNDYKFFVQLSYVIDEYDNFSSRLINEVRDVYDFLISEKFRTFIKAEYINFSNINDFSKYVCNFFKDGDCEKIKNDISKILVTIISDYKYEEEWFVLNESFKIPDNSIVEVYPDYIADNIGEQNVESCLNYFKSINNLKILIL